MASLQDRGSTYADLSLQISLGLDVVILFYSSATEYVVIKMVAAQAVGKCYHFVSLNNIYHLQKIYIQTDQLFLLFYICYRLTSAYRNGRGYGDYSYRM